MAQIDKTKDSYQTSQWETLTKKTTSATQGPQQNVQQQPIDHKKPPDPSGSTTPTPSADPTNTLGKGPGSTTNTGTTSTIKDLKDVTVDRHEDTITFWDHGSEDGDIININLNGQVLKKNLRLTKKKQFFKVQLSSGSNRFEVVAVNEGTSSPNTATVEISNVKQVQPTQIYERKTGQKASMNLNAP